jgi:hypothetical protein
VGDAADACQETCAVTHVCRRYVCVCVCLWWVMPPMPARGRAPSPTCAVGVTACAAPSPTAGACPCPQQVPRWTKPCVPSRHGIVSAASARSTAGTHGAVDRAVRAVTASLVRRAPSPTAARTAGTCHAREHGQEKPTEAPGRPVSVHRANAGPVLTERPGRHAGPSVCR